MVAPYGALPDVSDSSDKGNKPDEEVGMYAPGCLVLAAVAVEQGQHGEYGWAVFFQQGHRRCVLSARTTER
jgi:hypothetical protein